MTVFKVDDTALDLPTLGREEGTSFGWGDRWQQAQINEKYLTDYSDWEARDIYEMISRDYKAKQIENAQSLPIMSAEYQIVEGGEGDTGEAKWLDTFWKADPLQGGSQTSLDQIIGLCTSAFYFKRAYFEKVFVVGTGPFAGKITYGDVAYRPATTCRLMRDAKTGRYLGFEQEAYYVGPMIRQIDKWPVKIKAKQAFVFTHGTRKDPMNGVSDMEVAYWAYRTKQKILMLWFQFLQGVALPRVTVMAQDDGTARSVAQQMANLRSSGVLPISAPGGPGSVEINSLDLSGKGHEQFKEAIQWLDNAATQSVLAGFLELTSSANNGTGSYALSADASDFFLQSLEAKTRELEDQIRQNLFAPLIFANFGPDAVVPRLQFEPLNDIDKQSAINLLTASMAAPPGGPIPTSFIAGLAEQVSNYLGLDGAEMKEDFTQSFNAAAAQAKAQAAAEMGAAGGATPTGQAVAGMAGAVQAAQNAIQAGVPAKKAHKDARKAAKRDQGAVDSDSKASAGRSELIARHTDDALKAKTKGEKALGHPGA